LRVTIDPLFSAIEALPEHSILACRHGNGRHWRDIGHTFREMYCGRPKENRSAAGPSDGRLIRVQFRSER
jgi:hypothetical protein